MNLKVSPADVGKRLDVFVAEKTRLSRSLVRKLIDEDSVTVNKQSKPARYNLRQADKIVTSYSQPVIPEINLPVIYEDKDCLVIDKPTGVLSHSKGAYNPEATVATFIQPKIENMEGDRAGIVHRLDRATSGLIICAKTPQALSWLQKQFSQRKVKKTYYAVVGGRLDPSTAVIDVPIERNPKEPKSFRPGHAGRSAVTGYKVIEEQLKHSLVELTPTTGRTHQLRVHLQHLGHPIVGDDVYGGEPSPRMLLHASKLELTLPSGTRKVFESKLPDEFRAILDS